MTVLKFAATKHMQHVGDVSQTCEEIVPGATCQICCKKIQTSVDRINSKLGESACPQKDMALGLESAPSYIQRYSNIRDERPLSASAVIEM